jgi:hypothetical protein
VIAIGEIARPIEEEAAALAPILGISAWDVRMALTGTLPAIALRTWSLEQAQRAMTGLAARGVRALLADTSEVTPSERMIAVHRFTLEEEGLRARERGPLLPFSAIDTLVRVSSIGSVQRTEVERDMEPSASSSRPLVEREHTRSEREREQSLYLFRRDGATPWILRAREARYLGLGAARRLTVFENFLATIEVLRAKAPHARYDDRFHHRPLTRIEAVHVRGNGPAPLSLGDHAVDLHVHVLATWLAAPQLGPYRDGQG